MAERELLHLVLEDDWVRAQQVGEIPAHPGPFVHLSTPEQVALPANRLFAGRADVLLLRVDPQRLTGEVRWEPGVPGDPESMRFPHLYAPLPVSAVVGVLAYRPGPDGRFGAPEPAEP
ncbi:DUF952 domain-containing protein [Rhodococcus sp. X156]|uniref:DUF952 domain-containing protein n=1 Tax=Rhodococcus sp. X156 TaxID=2499145 RepID=UPI0013E3763A|nr:DUF952 domain-containing protein [Rhodococcus sp. X156]